MNAVLLFLYGLSAWGSLCNFVPWVILLVARWRQMVKPRIRDVRLLARLAMVLSSWALFWVSWPVASGLIEGDGLPARFVSFFGHSRVNMPAWFPAHYMICFTAAEALFVWIAACRAHETRRVDWSWRIYAIGVAGWCIIMGAGLL